MVVGKRPPQGGLRTTGGLRARRGKGPLRDVAARAYSELAIWNMALGDRGTAGKMAEQAAALAGPASLGIVGVARFLAHPPGTVSEMKVRVEGMVIPPVRNISLACALLLNGDFQPASEVLKEVYGSAAPGEEEGVPVMLAWAYLKTGRSADAAPLVRFNPIPSPGPVSPFSAFTFPRIVYLRGVAAEKAGKRDEARGYYHLFSQLSGPDPLVWGEEKEAH